MKLEFDIKSAGSYDVIVCGGGTSGCFAAIAAARQGVSVLLLERTFTIGGMLTSGEAGLTKFTEHCKDADLYKREVLDVLPTNPRSVQVVGGLAHEYAARMIKEGYAVGTSGETGSYVFTDRCGSQWVLIEMLEEAGVEVLYDTRVVSALMDGNRIRGVVVNNKDGFSEITGECVIDATGDADVAAFAGVEYHKGASEIDIKEGCGKYIGQMMQFGCMFRVRGVQFEKIFAYLLEHPERFNQHQFGVMTINNVIDSYRNGEMSVFRMKVDRPEGDTWDVQVYNLPAKDEAILLGPYVSIHEKDGTNARDLSDGQTALQLGARKLMNLMRNYPGFENSYVCYIPDVGVRETRHIVGEYTLTGIDVLSGKKFDDAIACGGHPPDIHPLPPEVANIQMNHWRFYIPYRVLVPSKIDGLLVAGRSISATRLAVGCARPTVQCMAMGEASGIASALAVKKNILPRNVNTVELQEALRINGAILD